LQASNLERHVQILLSTPPVSRESYYEKITFKRFGGHWDLDISPAVHGKVVSLHVRIGAMDLIPERALPFVLPLSKGEGWGEGKGLSASPPFTKRPFGCAVGFGALTRGLWRMVTYGLPRPAHRLPIACHQQEQSPPISTQLTPIDGETLFRQGKPNLILVS